MILGIGAGEAQNPTAGGGQMLQGPYDNIERAASQAKAEDANSIAALVDEVFNYSHSHERLPEVLETKTKGRLVPAEISYRRGNSPGVKEEQIANMLNNLAKRFGAPAYAMTNASQVRFLRMHMALTEPIFIGTGLTNPNAKVGDSVNDTMSPVQAIHLIDVLITQKKLNPMYQVPVTEWDPSKATFPRRPAGRLTASMNPKADEMRDILSKSVSGLTVDDAGRLIDEAFGTLGIR